MQHWIRIVLTILFFALLVEPLMAANEWWAVAVSGHDRVRSYGAAWNFPTRERAEEEALKVCREESGRDCVIQAAARNSCFAIYKTVEFDRGTSFGLRTFSRYVTRAEAEAEAASHIRRAREWIFLYGGEVGAEVESYSLELLECAGAHQ